MARLKSLLIDHKKIIITLTLFSILFSSISIINHFNFRTSARDLGIKNNEMYDYAHFRANECTLLENHFTNKLSDHFSLYPIVFAQFIWIFGTYTLLIFQILFILFGSIGMYRFVKEITGKDKLASWSMIHFLSLWGIYSALAFDYHDNVIASMFVPWFFLFIHQKKYALSSFFFILILIGKENMSFWMFFICIGLFIHYYKQKEYHKPLLIYASVSIMYFILTLNFIMPALADPENQYFHFTFNALGNDFKEALSTVISRPFYTLKLLFINHLEDPTFDNIKIEVIVTFLISGGIITILRPHFLIMLIPIFAQKMFNDHYRIWGVNFQYSIEFVPIIIASVYSFIATKTNSKKYNWLAVIFMVLSILTTLKLMDSRIAKWYQPEKQRFYQEKHYLRNEIKVKDVYKGLAKLPKDAKISAQTNLVPHVALRDKVYLFPDIQDANYIVLLPNDKYFFPMSIDEFNKQKKELYQSKKWDIYYQNQSITIFKISQNDPF